MKLFEGCFDSQGAGVATVGGEGGEPERLGVVPQQPVRKQHINIEETTVEVGTEIF